MSKPKFSRYIGIDYSGGQTSTTPLVGLQVYVAKKGEKPEPEPPKDSPNWTRKTIAEWLVDTLTEKTPTLIGIDHGFSFPQPYFDRYARDGLKRTWPAFLKDFQSHWPTGKDKFSVSFVRKNSGAKRLGDSHWRRLTEERARGAKSVFQFNVPGQVAYATHAGIPWLLFLRKKFGRCVHFWPFDGWDIPENSSAIVEIYPTLFSHCFAPEDRNPDQHDAYSVAAWMSESDRNGRLERFLKPELNREQKKRARIEGWILGVA
ncbi:MAG: hypothetical protein OXG62_06130 [Nitrospinae bacterium]|nr:hypothetical protein [Nitrospinota bacterium]